MDNKEAKEFVGRLVKRLVTDKEKMKQLTTLTFLMHKLEPEEIQALLDYHDMIEDNTRYLFESFLYGRIKEFSEKNNVREIKIEDIRLLIKQTYGDFALKRRE